ESFCSPPCPNVPSAATPYLASRRVAFIRCTLSPARWLQMMASRTSLSARRSKTPAPAWRSRLSSVTSWITSVEKFMASPAFAECTLWSCSQATRITNERLGEQVHPVQLELDQLLLKEHAAALLLRARQRQRHAAGVIADPERVGRELEVA